jgi:hypothetical protein
MVLRFYYAASVGRPMTVTHVAGRFSPIADVCKEKCVAEDDQNHVARPEAPRFGLPAPPAGDLFAFALVGVPRLLEVA